MKTPTLIILFITVSLVVLGVSSKLIYGDLRNDKIPAIGYRYAFKHGHAEIANHGTRIDSIYVDPMDYAQNRSEQARKMLIFIDGLKFDPAQELKPESPKFKKIALLVDILKLDSIHYPGIRWDNVRKLADLTTKIKSDQKQQADILKTSTVAKLSSLVDSIETVLLSHLNVKTTRLDTIRTEIGMAAYLNTHPQVLSWIIFHTTALSLSITTSLYLLTRIRRIRTDYLKKKDRVVYVWLFFGLASILLFLGFILFYKPIMLNGQEIMYHFSLIFNNPEYTVEMVAGLLMLMGFVPIAGILYVNLAVYQTLEQNIDDIPAIKQAEASKDLKDELNFLMLYLGLLVSASVIGSGLQRDMILQEITNGIVLFPDKMIYAYGFVFTFILFVLFVPSYAYLYHVSNKIAVADPALVPGEQKGWKIDEKMISDVKVALMVALPTIGSIVQQFFSLK